MTGIVGPEWLRQIESRRGAALGDGRELGQAHARRRDGRRHLRRHRGRPARNIAEVALSLDNPRPRRAGAFNEHDELEIVAPHRARRRLGSTASTAARCARATCSSSSPMPRPARIRRAGQPGPHRRHHQRQAGRAPRAPRRGGRHQPACIRAATRPSCGSRRPRANLARLDDVLADARSAARER